MKKLTYIAGAMALMLSLSSFVNPMDLDKGDKKEKTKTEKVKKAKKEKKTTTQSAESDEEFGPAHDIWAFGFSASFKDSAIYITDLQEIKDVHIQPKTKFLEDSPQYADQMKEYLEEKQGLKSRTCVMFYELEKKDAEKKLQTVLNRYNQETHLTIHMMDASDFTFKKP